MSKERLKTPIIPSFPTGWPPPGPPARADERGTHVLVHFFDLFEVMICWGRILGPYPAHLCSIAFWSPCPAYSFLTLWRSPSPGRYPIFVLVKFHEECTQQQQQDVLYVSLAMYALGDHQKKVCCTDQDYRSQPRQPARGGSPPRHHEPSPDDQSYTQHERRAAFGEDSECQYNSASVGANAWIKTVKPKMLQHGVVKTRKTITRPRSRENNKKPGLALSPGWRAPKQQDHH